MKANELIERTNDELIDQLKSLKDSLYRLRAQMTVSKVDNPKKGYYIKKDIARILTVLRSRGIKSKDIRFKKDKSLAYTVTNEPGVKNQSGGVEPQK